MAEYIDRETAINAVVKNDCEGYASWAIKSVPIADVVERKHGRDICDTVKGHCEFKCSVCGAWIGCVEGGTLDGGKFKFCPNCGARMESEGEE